MRGPLEEPGDGPPCAHPDGADAAAALPQHDALLRVALDPEHRRGCALRRASTRRRTRSRRRWRRGPPRPGSSKTASRICSAREEAQRAVGDLVLGRSTAATPAGASHQTLHEERVDPLPRLGGEREIGLGGRRRPEIALRRDQQHRRLVGEQALEQAGRGRRRARAGDRPGGAPRRSRRATSSTSAFSARFSGRVPTWRPGVSRNSTCAFGPVPDAEDAAARGLGLRGHDRELLAEQAIQERRLPGVGAAEERDHAGAVRRAGSCARLDAPRARRRRGALGRPLRAPAAAAHSSRRPPHRRR